MKSITIYIQKNKRANIAVIDLFDSILTIEPVDAMSKIYSDLNKRLKIKDTRKLTR